MRRLAFAVLLTLASAVPASAQEYLARPITSLACSSGEALIEMVNAGLENEAMAMSLWRSMQVSGTCKPAGGRLYLPEAIVHSWENDTTGTPGVIVAGFFIGPDGSKGERAFIWTEPKLLERFRPPKT